MQETLQWLKPVKDLIGKQYECAMFPEAARAKRDQRPPEEEDTCTMCGNYCAVKIVNEWLDQSDSELIK